jgi:hypothetical protein
MAVIPIQNRGWGPPYNDFLTNAATLLLLVSLHDSVIHRITHRSHPFNDYVAHDSSRELTSSNQGQILDEAS